jgi:hypothetical protein
MEVLKSPFSKGGFRGSIKRLYNPPCPPLEKGGGYFPTVRFWLVQYDAEIDYDIKRKSKRYYNVGANTRFVPT